MSRIIPLLVASLLLAASAEAADQVSTGRSASAPASHVATPDARKAWFARAVGDILDGRPLSNENHAGR